MHALVSGGAGFIGSHLAKRLIEQGAKVTIIDNLSTGLKSNIPVNCDFINLDISIENFSKKLPNTITHVFHLSSQTSAEISFENPLYDLKTNTLATLELLDWSLTNKIKKFVFTSSMNVYGNVPDQPITENYPTDPISFYGVGKVASENYIKIYSDLGLQSIVLRLFNIYGPGQNLDNLKQGMLSIYCAYIIKNKSLNVKGSLDRFRDFVYIDDVIYAILLALNFNKSFDIFNICTGKKTTIKEAIEKLFSAFNLENYPYYVSNGTPRDQFGVYGNPSKSNKILKWKSKVNLSEGIKRTVNWINSGNIENL